MGSPQPSPGEKNPMANIISPDVESACLKDLKIAYDLIID